MNYLLLVLLVGLLAVSGCVNQTQMSNTTNTQTEDTEVPTTIAPDTTPAPSFTANVGGSSNTGNDVTIYIQHENISSPISSLGGANVLGQGHWHYFIDGGAYNVTTSDVIDLPNMTPGKHSVRIRLQNNDHSDYLVNGSPVEDTVNFTVIGDDPSFSIDPIVVDGTNAKIKLNVFDFTIDAVNAGKTNVEKTGHFHWFLTRNEEAEGSYNLLTSDMLTITDLNAGNYSIRIRMQNNDHSDYLIKGLPVESTMSFTIVNDSMLIDPAPTEEDAGN